MDEPIDTAASPTESRPGGPGEGPQSQNIAIRSPSPTAKYRDWEGAPKGDLRVLGAQPEPYREPLILRHFRLFWEQRWLVLGVSLLPALLVALVLCLWPRKYTATFCFERSLAPSEYNVLRRRFRRQENLDKIIGRLQAQGLACYIRQLERARTPQAFDKLIVLAKIEKSLLTYYTAQQYLGFVGEQLLACKDPALGDHLRSYIRKAENLVLVNTRAGKRPVVYALSKNVLGNRVLTFLLFLMITMFAAVLREHRHERRRATIPDGGPGSQSGVTALGIAD
jgi:hypothetical protein